MEQVALDLIESGRGLFAFGSVGTGKTLYVAELTVQAIGIRASKRKGPFSHAFITVPELLHKLREAQASNGVGEILDYYSNVGWLVLDDLGVEHTTDWVFQTLYLLINRRYDNMKITLFTSNFGLKQLAEKWGDLRLSSRIKAMCKVKRFTGEDKRQ